MEALRGGGHPFASRFSEQTAAELTDAISIFRPSHLIVSRIDLAVYLDAIKREFDGVVILDLDESAASTGPSIHRLLANPGQALLFRAFSERVVSLEQSILPQVDQVWVSSEVERQMVITSLQGKQGQSHEISVVPNSVAVDAYSQGPDSARVTKTIIFPGSFAYEPSVDAARILIDEIMPLLPETRLMFVGSHIPTWMRDLRRENISCEGPVADIVPYLHAASAIVIPIRAGGGTRLKAIESLAAGLPVISTSFGVEGLGLNAGTDYLEASSASEFATQIRRVLDTAKLARELAENGRAIASERFSIESLEKLLHRSLHH
jgi:glycosyltransferase involved in cell wall biosynthesis